MSDDLVKRLRAPWNCFSESHEGHRGPNNAPQEAADRIDALTAERDALAEKLAATNEKLKHIVDEYDSLPWGPVIRAIAPARATLADITGETDDHTD